MSWFTEVEVAELGLPTEEELDDLVDALVNQYEGSKPKAVYNASNYISTPGANTQPTPVCQPIPACPCTYCALNYTAGVCPPHNYSSFC